MGTMSGLTLAVVVGGAGAAFGAGDRPRPEANRTGSGTKLAGLAGAALLGVVAVVWGEPRFRTGIDWHTDRTPRIVPYQAQSANPLLVLDG